MMTLESQKTLPQFKILKLRLMITTEGLTPTVPTITSAKRDISTNSSNVRTNGIDIDGNTNQISTLSDQARNLDSNGRVINRPLIGSDIASKQYVDAQLRWWWCYPVVLVAVDFFTVYKRRWYYKHRTLSAILKRMIGHNDTYHYFFKAESIEGVYNVSEEVFGTGGKKKYWVQFTKAGTYTLKWALRCSISEPASA